MDGIDWDKIGNRLTMWCGGTFTALFLLVVFASCANDSGWRAPEKTEYVSYYKDESRAQRQIRSEYNARMNGGSCPVWGCG